ncbi:MAG: hypothetical protein R3Y24_00050 [Eubacteriales bacterium]
MASTLNYLREHDMLEYEVLEKKTLEATEKFDILNSGIKSCEVRMTEIKTLKCKHYNLYENERYLCRI